MKTTKLMLTVAAMIGVSLAACDQASAQTLAKFIGIVDQLTNSNGSRYAPPNFQPTRPSQLTPVGPRYQGTPGIPPQVSPFPPGPGTPGIPPQVSPFLPGPGTPGVPPQVSPFPPSPGTPGIPPQVSPFPPGPGTPGIPPQVSPFPVVNPPQTNPWPIGGIPGVAARQARLLSLTCRDMRYDAVWNRNRADQVELRVMADGRKVDSIRTVFRKADEGGTFFINKTYRFSNSLRVELWIDGDRVSGAKDLGAYGQRIASFTGGDPNIQWTQYDLAAVTY